MCCIQRRQKVDEILKKKLQSFTVLMFFVPVSVDEVSMYSARTKVIVWSECAFTSHRLRLSIFISIINFLCIRMSEIWWMEREWKMMSSSSKITRNIKDYRICFVFIACNSTLIKIHFWISTKCSRLKFVFSFPFHSKWTEIYLW